MSNLAVEDRFANGTQGRLLHWFPDSVARRQALPASHPELLVRFAKESAIHKPELFPDKDHIDVIARMETLVAVPGQPVLLQVPVVPCYGLTVHKTQSLSIKHVVRGCLEGVFAYGQIYVLVSRVTDPMNFQLIGMPPADMMDEVAIAWRAEGLDVVECLRRATTVTAEWIYEPGDGELRDRFRPKKQTEQTVPVKHRELWEILNPQPRAAAVLHRLLDWIDRADYASQRREPRPFFGTPEGDAIFPEGDDPWWLTEMQRRKSDSEEEIPGDEDGPVLSGGDDGPAEEALTEDDDCSSSNESFPEPPRDDHAQGNANWDPRLAWLRVASAHGSSSSGSAEPTTAECDAMDCTDTPSYHAPRFGSEAPSSAVAEQITPDDAQSTIQTAYHECPFASSSKTKQPEEKYSATLPTMADSADLDMYLMESLDSAPLGQEPMSTVVAEQSPLDHPE